jgi:hypothetical protein
MDHSSLGEQRGRIWVTGPQLPCDAHSVNRTVRAVSRTVRHPLNFRVTRDPPEVSQTPTSGLQLSPIAGPVLNGPSLVDNQHVIEDAWLELTSHRDPPIKEGLSVIVCSANLSKLFRQADPLAKSFHPEIAAKKGKLGVIERPAYSKRPQGGRAIQSFERTVLVAKAGENHGLLERSLHKSGGNFLRIIGSTGPRIRVSEIGPNDRKDAGGKNLDCLNGSSLA